MTEAAPILIEKTDDNSSLAQGLVPTERTDELAGHTPGPWRIDVNGSERWSVDYEGPSSTYMTICGSRNQPVGFAVWPNAFGNDAELEANARLFAAAPALLKALTELLAASEAEYGIPDDGDEDDEPVGWSAKGGLAVTFGQLRRARAAIAQAQQVTHD